MNKYSYLHGDLIAHNRPTMANGRTLKHHENEFCIDDNGYNEREEYQCDGGGRLSNNVSSLAEVFNASYRCSIRWYRK